MRKQGIALEHHGRAAVRCTGIRDVAPAQDDVARSHHFMASDHAQGRCFAATRRPEQATVMVGGNGEIYAVDCDAGGTVMLG